MALAISCAPGAAPESHNDDAVSTGWPVYRGNNAGSAYSPLAQIDRDNVHQLRVAWVFRTGDGSGGNQANIETNPLLANGKLYIASPRSKIMALNPATGALIWSFDPGVSGTVRGLSYWADGDDRRILVPVQRYLYAIDADDGTPIASFGDHGRVDTRYGLGRNPDSVSVSQGSPGAVFEDRIILGSNVGDAPGHIRAYDVRTGAIAWTFHTIPQPGEFGYDTWPAEAYKEVGGVNSWSGMSLDPERATVFLSTGSGSSDFYGGNRKGKNLFANSLIALDARTGERRWHYQMLYHDVWDWDPAAPPTLVTVVRGARRIAAVAQVTKTGFVFVFNRETGEPLFPIEDRPVPPSDLPGEETWPTQPIPSKPAPFVRQGITEADITTISPEAHDFVLKRFRELRSGPMFTPPSTQGTLTLPGTWGGAEWSGSAFDPESSILYVNANEIPSIIQLLPGRRATGAAGSVERGRSVFLANGCSGCHGVERKGGDGPSLVNVRQRLSRDSLEHVIRNGRGGMPSFSSLSTADMRSLLPFLLDEGGAATAGATATPVIPQGSSAQAPRPDERHSYRSGGYEKLRDQQGLPGIKPPWGTLTAVNLNDGERVWQIPLGEYPGVPASLQPTGTPNFGGAIVTKGGLVFIGATMDEKFRAIDKATGKILWEQKLPAGGYATPATYEYEGKQYVVIAAGGGGKTGTPSGDSYVAFALP